MVSVNVILIKLQDYILTNDSLSPLKITMNHHSREIVLRIITVI